MTNDHGKCPHCGADLNGGSIWQHFYNREMEKGLDADVAAYEADRIAEMYGATRTEGQWGREIAIYDWDKDRTVEYQCPDCEGVWPRVGII